jgi:hypothetical protein
VRCPCCSGTDMAHDMSEPCYALVQEQEFERDRREEEYYFMREHGGFSMSVWLK